MVGYTIEKGPAYSILKVRLAPGESVTIEPGSYMLHRGVVDVSTSSQGALAGLARRFLGGESFFLNTFTARTEAEVWVAPSLPGDIAAIELTGGELYVQNSSYLAHIGSISVSVGWRGFRGVIAEGELFWLKVGGVGLIFVNSYGAIERLDLAHNERVTVDNMHFVAMDSTVQWGARKLGNVKTLLLGGEGLVVDAVGPGRIWVQTRTPQALAQALSRYIRAQSGGK